MFEIKRGTIAVIPVTITGVSESELKEVEVAFRLSETSDGTTVLPQKYTGNFVAVSETCVTFNVTVPADETKKLPLGIIYMDVLPVTSSGKLNSGRVNKGRVVEGFF